MTRDTAGMRETSSGPAGGRDNRPRRALLTGAAAALGVIAAETLAGATPAQAQGDQANEVILGTDNTGATARTGFLSATDIDLAALLADPSTGAGVAGFGSSSSGVGVEAFGGPANGIGVQARGQGTGDGVQGAGGLSGGTGVTGFGGSFSGAGVAGTGGSTDGHGVVGTGAGKGTGVAGTGGPNGIGVAGTGGTGNGAGVFGGGGGSTGTGVVGFGAGFLSGGNGIGVAGLGTGTGDGVQGRASTGSGVHGTATTTGGVGVLAENTGGGPAFKAAGPALFSRSGTVVIPSGKTKATVTPPGGLSSSALVLALMQNVAAGVMVMAAVPSPAVGTFQIVLNKAPKSPATATVAWFVVN